MGTDTAACSLHIVFLPFYSTSHITPCVQAARILASRPAVRATIVTTDHNALIFKSDVNADADSGKLISVRTLKFPSDQVGLPAGIENFQSITHPEMSARIFHGIGLLQNPTQQLIRELNPDCIFSDMFFPWSADLAAELGIPRLHFYPSSFLYHSVFDNLRIHAPQDHVSSESESFLVPGLPVEITMKRSQLQDHLKSKTVYGEMIDKIKQSENRSFGLVHNTFYEIEPEFAEHSKKTKPMKVWHIGPLFQYFNVNSSENAENRHGCLRWLDSQQPDSVLFVCFGSMVKFPETQLAEIAAALEESEKPYIWVVNERAFGEEDPDGYVESDPNRGMIVRGWVPQVKVLEHPAVGGFMTHCGWNSVLEAAVAGVPMVTWPLYAEQFYNEKLVELLRVGMKVGAEVWNPGSEIKSPIVGKDAIRRAVCRLMCDSEEAAAVRRAAKELAVKAAASVREGGSSYEDVTALIEDIKGFRFVNN